MAGVDWAREIVGFYLNRELHFPNDVMVFQFPSELLAREWEWIRAFASTNKND